MVFRGWPLVGAAFVLQGLVTAALSYSYGVILAPVGAEFGATRLQMSLGMTASTLCSGLLSPFAGIAIDRFRLRTLAVVGALLLGTAWMLISRSDTMPQVIAIYLLCMAPAMTLLGPLLVGPLLARWFRRRRGIAMGIAALGTSVFGLVVPPLLQHAIGEYGWRVALEYGAMLMVLFTVPAALLLVDRPEDIGQAPDGDAGAPPPPAVPDSSSTRAILVQPNFWAVTFALGMLFSVYTTLMVNLVPLALGEGHAAGKAAWLMSGIALFGMLGKLVFGAVADRVDLRVGLGAAIVLVLASLALLVADTRFTSLALASALLGFAAGGMLPVWGALMALLFGAANYGRAMGLMNPMMMPIVLAGPPFAGWVFDRSGSYALAFAVFAGALAGALFALSRVRVTVPSG